MQLVLGWIRARADYVGNFTQLIAESRVVRMPAEKNSPSSSL